MAGFHQFSAGRKVYDNGSYAPTRGPVSAQGAQGYLKRELKNRNQGNQGTYGGVSKVGSDGQSDTRSGVAAQALQRSTKTAAGPWKPGTGGAQKSGGVGASPFNPGPKNPKPPGTGGVRPPTGGTTGGGTGSSGGGTTPPDPAAPVVPPSVTINAAGQLELPYNEAWTQGLIENMGEFNQQLADMQLEGQQQQLEYSDAKRNSELQYGQIQKQTLNNNAAGGTAFSSMYGQGVVNNANAYNNQVNSLDQANASFQNNMALQRSTIESSFNDQLRKQALEYAKEVALDAGNLGYDTPKPVKPKPGENSSSTGPNGPKNQVDKGRERAALVTFGENGNFKGNKNPKPGDKNKNKGNGNKKVGQRARTNAARMVFKKGKK